MSTLDGTVGPCDVGSAPSSTAADRHPNAWLYFVLAAGVVGPVIAICFELACGMCSFVFNPIPTWWHLVLLGLVPVGNLAVVWACRSGRPPHGSAAAPLVGAAVGVSFFYSLQFLPLAPFSLLAIMAFGLGLLGLTPFFALAASIVAARRLAASNPARAGSSRLFRIGIAATVLALALYLSSQALTLVGVRMAASGDDAERLRGVRVIRTFGSEPALLRACYNLPMDVWVGLLTSNTGENHVSSAEAREIYYRVTGEPFNSVPPPRRLGVRSFSASDFNSDSDVGGTAVNGAARGVSLASSRMDTVVEPDALTAYTEWTMVLSNSSIDQREARAEIALPPGGVVSRLTLWIEGEEREAAFSTRGKVRAAYEKVAVVQRRDPVLVTTCGPDRVLMQCFPVPPNGGAMKVRIGITSPLALDGLDTGRLALPRFVERNFLVPDSVRHLLFAESSRDLRVVGVSGRSGRSVMARIADTELAGRKVDLSCSRDPEVTAVWTPDMVVPEEYAVVQDLEPARPDAPDRIAVVIDGSRVVGAAREDVAEAVRKLPTGCRLQIVHAGERLGELAPPARASANLLRSAGDAIVRARYVGGVDNRPALIEVWEALASSGGGVIVWIHGPQPFALGSETEQLAQLAERRPGAVKLVAVAVEDGRNAVLADLERVGAAVSVPRRGALATDLGRLFEGWADDAPAGKAVVRRRVPVVEARGVRCSSHVARLWALDEVTRMCAARDNRRTREASLLAARYQLVTPVSGAVVLETEEQYRSAGLDPVDPASVPEIVPEPPCWLVMGVGAVLLGAARLRGRRAEAMILQAGSAAVPPPSRGRFRRPL